MNCFQPLFVATRQRSQTEQVFCLIHIGTIKRLRRPINLPRSIIDNLHVYYKGTAKTLGSLTIGEGNDVNVTYYCFTEDQPTDEDWESYPYWWHYDPETEAPTPWTKNP